MRYRSSNTQLIILLLILTGLQATSGLAQPITLQTVQNNISKFSSNFQQERMYIQFDKPAYSPGETIWFKAYLMAGLDISEISKSLYIDFTDADGAVLIHFISPVVQASARGQFDIPSDYAGKAMHIKAYTKWMLNFDTAFCYNKDIRIIQTKQPSLKNVAKQNIPVINFFPEGGDCIAGIKSKVAFKATDIYGMPVNIKGAVVNHKGAILDSIRSIHDGMGFFYLEPGQGESYSAKWKDEKGTVYQTDLPAIKNAGATLEIHPSRGMAGFLIRRSDNAPASFHDLHIIATLQQSLVYLASINLEATPMAGGSIPTAELPSGILQVTLFDSDWVPVAERITFINNDDYHFEPEVGFSVLGTSKRARNVLVISMPENIAANLSVAITDAGIGMDSTDDIISRLMLTGDLKGFVYHPSRYFFNSSDSIAQHLDLLMLTNGWRKYHWEEIVQGKMPAVKYPRDSSYLAFGGKVYGASPELLRGTGALLAIVSPKDTTQRQILTLPIDKDGSFLQPDYVFFDTIKVFYQFAGTKDLANSTEVIFNAGTVSSPKKVQVDKNSFIYSLIDTAGDAYSSYLASEQAKLAKLLEGTTLPGVIVKSKTKSPMEILDDKYTSGLFSGGDAVQFDVLNDVGSKAAYNVLTYLQGRVAGLMITAANTAGGQNSLSWRGSTPQIYMDEIPVSTDQVTNLSMSDIAYIKVFRPPFIGGFGGGGAGGAIAIYTRKGGDIVNKPGKGLPYKLIYGYTPLKEFYSPNYGTFDQRNEMQDLRSTLYWNPMILTTPENHVIKIPFYNNDITGSFRVILEGVSADGKLTRIIKTIE